MQLKMNGVEFSYDSTPVLQDICIELHQSEVLGILGPNGSGKTTMIRCMNGILTPQQGSILLDETDVRDLSRIEIAKNISYVPQNSADNMTSPTVYEIVLMGRRPHITWEFSEFDKKIAWNAMEEMDVKQLASTAFNKLSNGQAQRVLIARSIAQEANIILLDEPTSNLDVRYQLDVMDTLCNLVHQKNICACTIMHDLDLAMRFCDKVILLNKGRITAAGPTQDVLTSENIKEVYEINAVIDTSYDRPRVLIM